MGLFVSDPSASLWRVGAVIDSDYDFACPWFCSVTRDMVLTWCLCTIVERGCQSVDAFDVLCLGECAVRYMYASLP